MTISGGADGVAAARFSARFCLMDFPDPADLPLRGDLSDMTVLTEEARVPPPTEPTHVRSGDQRAPYFPVSFTIIFV